MDHFSGYRVTGICQKKKIFLVIDGNPVQRLLSEIFYRIETAVEKESLVNLLCSPEVIKIDGRRLPLGKVTYFKDVILFNGLDEVFCHDYNKFLINAHICSSKGLLPSSFVV